MFTLLNGLKIYDSVVSLTGGGPSRQTVVLPMWIIENAFTYSNFGYASAMCIAFIIVVLIFNIVLRTVFLSACLIGLAAAFKVGTAGILSTAITDDVGWTGIIVA